MSLQFYIRRRWLSDLCCLYKIVGGFFDTSPRPNYKSKFPLDSCVSPLIYNNHPIINDSKNNPIIRMGLATVKSVMHAIYLIVILYIDFAICAFSSSIKSAMLISVLREINGSTKVSNIEQPLYLFH